MGYAKCMDNNYWLRRVIAKLYAKLLSNDVLGNWTPDDKDPEQESRALDTLELVGIIKSPAYFEGADYRILDIRSGHAQSAPTRQLVDFDYDKFIQFCELNGLNPTPNGVPARLEIVDDVQPVIYIEDKRYVLTALDDSGLPQKIVAFAWKNPDNERISLDELRQNINMTQIKKDDARLTQVFDKKNVFGKRGILKSFAEIDVREFRLKRSALLTPSEVEAIELASTNR